MATMRRSHPYIAAAKYKKKQSLNSTETFISSKSRKRKFIDTMEDEDDDLSLAMQPRIKRHITEQDVSSIHHSLSSLTFKAKKTKNQRIGKKRKFTEMNDEFLCKDLERKIKKIKLSNPKKEDKNDHQNMDIAMNDEEIKSDFDEVSDLIPCKLTYAEIASPHNEHPLIHSLYRNGNALHHHATTLNGHNGALVKYKEPKDSWKELIEKCCTNEGETCCEMKRLQLQNADIEMKETKKKKRPIRLHTSYSFNGIRPKHNMNSTQMKEMANKCYVSSMTNKSK